MTRPSRRRVFLWAVLIVVLAFIAAAEITHAQTMNMAEEVSDLKTKVAVLESQMGEIVWLARAVVVGVLGQLWFLLRRPRVGSVDEVVEGLRALLEKGAPK